MAGAAIANTRTATKITFRKTFLLIGTSSRGRNGRRFSPTPLFYHQIRAGAGGIGIPVSDEKGMWRALV
jgi:hypothetical protein